jgi:hypothetical protein
MPISKDDFQRIDEQEATVDLGPDTTQGKIHRFLLGNADQAFRQREIVDGVEVPKGSVGPTLKRLERHGLVTHRGRYWKIADAEHATASAARLGAAVVDARDGGFSDEEVDAWMESAVDPVGERGDEDA